MVKPPAAIAKLPNLVAECLNHLKQTKPTFRFQSLAAKEEEENSRRDKKKKKMMTESSSSNIDITNNNRSNNRSSNSIRLSDVVSDCVKRWFMDTLKEAKAGDTNMQVLVSQMYSCGYGVPPDSQLGRVWMTRASRNRSSVWKVSNKRPGYNASDSDSDEL
ncbi:hypothetical protein LINPERHAP2_LOCUS12898 [Linum perenne]